MLTLQIFCFLIHWTIRFFVELLQPLSHNIFRDSNIGCTEWDYSWIMFILYFGEKLALASLNDDISNDRHFAIILIFLKINPLNSSIPILRILDGNVTDRYHTFCILDVNCYIFFCVIVVVHQLSQKGFLWALVET